MKISVVTITLAAALAVSAPAFADTPVQPVDPPCYLDAHTLKVVGMSFETAQDMYNHPEKYSNIPWCNSLKGVFLGDLDTNHNGLVDALEPAPSTTPLAPTAAPATSSTQANTAKPATTANPSTKPAATPTTASPSPTASPAPAVLGANAQDPAKNLTAAAHHQASIIPGILVLLALLVASGLGYVWRSRRHKPEAARETTN